jgi:molybdate transport system substrate-binding protein
MLGLKKTLGTSLLALSCAAAFASVSASASAATLNVLTTGAFKQVAVALSALYESRTGNKIKLDNDTAGALAKRIEAGAHFDVVILTPDLIKALVDKNKVRADSVANLGRVAIGVMVPAGAPLPAIDTVEHFKQALLDAKSVAYIDPASGGSSGIYLAKLFQQWGIAQQIDAKAVKVHGGSVAEHIVDGEAVLGIHQISEILPTKGVTLVGPLPAEIQNYTVYTAAVSNTSSEPAAAKAFLQLLTSPEAAKLLKEKGMEAAKP